VHVVIFGLQTCVNFSDFSGRRKRGTYKKRNICIQEIRTPMRREILCKKTYKYLGRPPIDKPDERGVALSALP